MLKQSQAAYLRLMHCLTKENVAFKLIFMQFRKGTKEQEYLSVLQMLKAQDILAICEFIFKDRLFSSVSNYSYVMA